MLIADQGQVVEFCAEPGEFIFDMSTEPSIFNGPLGAGIIDTFKNIGKRFTFGGQPGKDQRIYYFNLKEITENKFGTPAPIPFRVVDNNIGLDIDISIRCNGKYSYRITDPLLFYTNVCGNVMHSYMRAQLDGQLKSELLTKLQPAFSQVSDMGIRYSALPGHTLEISSALNELLSEKWSRLRGLSISSFSIKSVSASPEDEQLIKDLQRNAVMRNAEMAGATLVTAQADAMRNAAENQGGAMMGFMGMNAAMNAGSNASGFFQMAQQQRATAPPPQPPQSVSPQINPQQNGWVCTCNTVNSGRFCSDCGTPQPQQADTWICSCSTENRGNFCQECGNSRPVPVSDLWTCSCGVSNRGRFCADCGAPRD